MIQSIKEELTEYILYSIKEYDNLGQLIKDGELHHELFNTNYYIIGYTKAKEWLAEHDVCVFEALKIIKEYEEFNFGECKHYTNAVETVNMLVYIYGEELLNSNILKRI